MLRQLIFTFCLIAAPAFLATPVFADPSVLSIAQDRYETGATIKFEGPAVADLFMAGNKVDVAAPVAGSAYLAGRRITVEASVAGDLFAAGYSVNVSGAVGGDASVTGYEVTLGPVTGNVRAAGNDVIVGTIGGYALITGQDVTLNGAIAGDMVLAADQIIFGPQATVAGKLTIYANDPASIKVPENVAPAGRVNIEAAKNYNSSEWSKTMPPMLSFWQIISSFLFGVLISGLIAAMVIAIAPKSAQKWREMALAHPGHAIWSGFLVTSALAGSGFVLMLTIIGVFLLPVMMMVTVVAIFAGYSLGSYVLAAKLWLATGREMPFGLLGKFLLACLGAFLAGLAWLVPVAGWFFVLGLTMLGVGTLAAFAVPDSWQLLRSEVAPV
jgi:cytoskeletal protein CcmA (bactofilin family)